MYNQLKKIGYEIIDDNSDQRYKYQPRSLSPGDYDFNQCDDDLYFSRNEFHQNITKLRAKRLLGNEIEQNKLRVLSCDIREQPRHIDDSVVCPLLSIMRSENCSISEKNTPIHLHNFGRPCK